MSVDVFEISIPKGRRFEMSRLVVATFVVTSLLLSAFPVQAEEGGGEGSPRAAAAALVAQGEVAYQEGRYPDAVSHFRQARGLLPQEGVIAINLAMALEGEGSCGSLQEAREIYTSFLGAHEASSVWHAAEGGQRRVEPLIESVCEEDWVPSGNPIEQPGPREGDPDPGDPESSDERSPSESAAWSLLGASLAISVVGGGLWVGASIVAGDRDEECGRQCDDEAAAARWDTADERRETYALWGDILFFSGVGLAAICLTWGLLARRSRLSQPELGDSAVSFLPTVGPRGGGFILRF